MDRSKVIEYFDGKALREPINVIGAGAVGSHVCEQLARLGCDNITIWDFDTVSAHNITNQMFVADNIGGYKTEAMANLMRAINPDINVVERRSGLKPPYVVNGYIFLCVDNIDLRREIIKANANNPYAKMVFDFRMGLLDGQHYAASFRNRQEVDELLAKSNFSQAEAEAAAPRTACGTELSVIYTVKMIVSAGMANFVKAAKGLPYNKTILVNTNLMSIDAF